MHVSFALARVHQANPIKIMIGGIQSNLGNEIVWFNIKPNYFISINDPNLEDTVRIRIKSLRHIECQSPITKSLSSCYYAKILTGPPLL